MNEVEGRTLIWSACPLTFAALKKETRTGDSIYLACTTGPMERLMEKRELYCGLAARSARRRAPPWE